MDYKTKLKRNRRGNHKNSNDNKLFIAGGFYLVLVILALNANISWAIVGWYIVIGLVTFFIYAKDKRAAKNGSWRVSESSLHSLSIVGGWAGAIFAQNLLRHKTKKSDFKSMFYLTVIINLAGLIYFVLKAA